MNRKELMERLDISQATFYRDLKEGLPSEDSRNTIFDEKKVLLWIDSRNKAAVKQLEVGKTYSNEVIAEAFKCSTQGGMRRSHTSHSLVLFSDHTGNAIYEDKWIENTLHYTGMGLEGDQSIEQTQNKVLANSNRNRVRVYLFETYQPTEHTYLGQVELVEEPYTISEKDTNGKERLVYKFPLKVVDKEFSIEETKIEEAQQEKEKKIKTLSPEEVARRAKLVSEGNKVLAEENKKRGKDSSSYRYTKKKEFIRDPLIAEYVKKLAKGICQLCEEPAPFEKDGKPFLHSHHIEHLANGGLDTIENSIAVCPNCHSRIHELEDVQDKIKLLKKVSERKCL